MGACIILTPVVIAAWPMLAAAVTSAAVAAGFSSSAKMSKSAVRNVMGTGLADQTGATSSNPPTRNPVSTTAAVMPGANRSGNPAAVRLFN